MERNLHFELKLLADIGLVGFPNAGKSTLISRISAARPKIADYPFTTLQPGLGVVSADGAPGKPSEKGGGRTFVVADLPGLIEGAHTGVGLGIRFLKHIERTRLVAHLIDTSDASDRDPVHDFEIIAGELAAFSEKLAEKPVIVVATKLDATTDRTRLEKLRRFLRRARTRVSRHLVRHRAKAFRNWCGPWRMRWTGWLLPSHVEAETPEIAEGGNAHESAAEPEADGSGSRCLALRSLPFPVARRKVARAPRKARRKKEDR